MKPLIRWLPRADAHIAHCRLSSRLLRVGALVVGVLGVCAVLGLAFALGVMAGAQRSSPVQPMVPPYLSPSQEPAWPPGQAHRGEPSWLPLPRGAFGSITAIEGDRVIILDRRTGRRLMIRIGQGTVIERGRARRIPPQDLQVGERVFIFGSPAMDAIDAEFIGVMHQQPLNLLVPPVRLNCERC